MLELNNRVSLTQKRKRIGRGGSRGGTSGRGTKGQNSRSGAGRKLRAGFEGGQMPLHRRLPKRGFNNANFKIEYDLINLGDLELRFENGQQVTKELLVQEGLIKSVKARVKLLGNGDFSKKVTILVDACSAPALEKVKSCGGEVILS